MVGHWRESPLKMEHAWSQGWATECSKCLSLGLGETWPPGQRLSSQRRLCAYQHHSSQWPRSPLTMQRRPFSPHATSAKKSTGAVDKSFEFCIPRQRGQVLNQVRKVGGNLKNIQMLIQSQPTKFCKWAKLHQRLKLFVTEQWSHHEAYRDVTIYHFGQLFHPNQWFFANQVKTTCWSLLRVLPGVMQP